ncbi:type II toxin-antitoxin system VapC family toxin [Flavobacterium phragmitis]|uniref:Predicted nucleic acid-binding protein, contains PIN domain n=1 Tax=Flavobacterium phragmitis TaxID=739143 RepID=A0A1I1UXE7_9FLAO|nr:PIN domain-containing protein [Flavobacterium phragmitis]SFD75456.1 Predicted nucleic acid-binding protein, contains PIN domain [Flavobacterium phragmitis]
MKNVFIDTNILMDIFANRQPFVHNSLKIYTLGVDKKIKLYSTSNTIITLHYLLKRLIPEEKIRMALDEITQNIEIIPIDVNIIKKSLKSNHKDFEDAIQITSAQSINSMDCIITRDLKDFKFSEINVFTPDEFLNTL